MTVKEPPKPPKTQKGKNQKSQKKLNDHDKILITKHLEDNKHLAIASKTEAITTKGIIVQVLGKDPGDKDLQNQVSKYLKSLGWEKSKYQKTINGERHYIWSNPLLLNLSEVEPKKGVKQQSQTIDRQSLQSPTQLPNRINQSDKLNKGLSNSTNPCDSNDSSPTQPPKISHQTQPDTAFCNVPPESKIIERNNLELNKVGCTEQNIKDVASMLFDYPEATSVLEEVYEPALIKAAQEVKLKQVKIKILNTIINLWVSNAEKSYMTKVCEGLKEKYGLPMIIEACSQATRTTLGQLLKHIPLVGESLRYRG